ncbi:MAG: hypothetical protein U0575_05215 [Phycisphaerales bacterium]
MRTRVPACVAVAAIAACLALSACVERKERITVHGDGTIDLSVRHSSTDAEDLLQGDALPDLAAGWETQLREEPEDGKTKYVYEATATTVLGQALPSRYGMPRDAFEAQFLQFPTTITMERRKDGTWYHFRRVYEPRRWGELKALSESPEAKRLQEAGDPGAEPDADRVEQFTRALVDLQAARLLLFARAALLEVAPRVPQDGWLRVRDSMKQLAQEIDARAVVDDLMHATRLDDEGKKAAAIQKALKRIEGAVAERLQLAVRTECGFGGTELSAFTHALEKHQREGAVTEDLADDSFEIVVELPGEIMGSNADSAAGGRATWRFKGEDLMDRPRELLASSRVGG